MENLDTVDSDLATLTGIWMDALDSVADLADSLTRSQWDASSPCPGWSAGDVVAHVVALESEMHGEPQPDHTPDFTSLPHATAPLSQYTEVGVDLRRGRHRSEVVGELRTLTKLRREDLTPPPTDETAQMPTFAGIVLPARIAIQTRIFDTWVHEQDIRVAAMAPGNYESPAAWVTAARFLSGLPYVWGKAVDAPIGSTVVLDVTGPGVAFRKCVVRGDDGRAGFIDHEPNEPTLLVRLPLLNYVLLCAGRQGALAMAHQGGSEIQGDSELADRFLKGLAVTP